LTAHHLYIFLQSAALFFGARNKSPVVLACTCCRALGRTARPLAGISPPVVLQTVKSLVHHSQASLPPLRLYRLHWFTPPRVPPLRISSLLRPRLPVPVVTSSPRQLLHAQIRPRPALATNGTVVDWLMNCTTRPFSRLLCLEPNSSSFRTLEFAVVHPNFAAAYLATNLLPTGRFAFSLACSHSLLLSRARASTKS
jgi:hypothetical protein